MKSNQIKKQILEKLLSELKSQDITKAELARRLEIDPRVLNTQLSTSIESTSISKLLEFLEAIGVEAEITFHNR